MVRRLCVCAACLLFIAEAGYGVPYYEDSLAAYWKLDGDAVDATGRNSGTVIGATSSAGKFGMALSFDGVNDYVDIGMNTITSGATTVAYWYDWNTGNTNVADLKIVGTNGAFIGSTDYAAGFAVRGEGVTVMNTNAFNVVGWTHVAITYNGGTLTDSANYGLYINGQSVAIYNAGSNGIGWSKNVLGGVNGGSESFCGLLDDMGVWDRALDGYEINAIYESGIDTFEAILAASDEILSLDYTTEELNQLSEIYISQTAEPVMIGDVSWRYLDLLPNQSAHEIGESYVDVDSGKYYIYLGSGLEGTPAGGEVPEPSTLLLLLPLAGMYLFKRRAGRVTRHCVEWPVSDFLRRPAKKLKRLS